MQKCVGYFQLRNQMSKRKKFELLATCFDSKGRVICSRPNSYLKSHPEQKRFSIMAGMSDQRCVLHAETAALLASRNSKGVSKVHSVLVQRFDSRGNPALAKPCLSCMLALKMFNVRVLRYTTYTGINEEIL